ncbi:hypothetical protein Sango_2925300 [Sesamum angolense]|uniref:Uncharacterized protein n=1 Tax=Sesamum angolense TaxID=2727404 RepID=A0AAE1T5H8_9LAMI|nr:hypothetical protein Sango_2925300 [Sesamum angolense]
MAMSLNVISGSTDYNTFQVKGCAYDKDEIQGHRFKYPIRTLTLGGCHMVLGGNWLRKYNPVEYDYVGMVVTMSKRDEKLRLQSFAYVFQEPKGLPPNRGIEHQIPLKPHVIPNKMHLYRYSYS